MAPAHSKAAAKDDGSSASSKRSGLNEALARGKRLQQEKKNGLTPESLLLDDGSCSMTLAELMDSENLSWGQAQEVCLKFRAEAAQDAVKHPKAEGILPTKETEKASCKTPPPADVKPRGILRIKGASDLPKIPDDKSVATPVPDKAPENPKGAKKREADEKDEEAAKDVSEKKVSFAEPDSQSGHKRKAREEKEEKARDEDKSAANKPTSKVKKLKQQHVEMVEDGSSKGMEKERKKKKSDGLKRQNAVEDWEDGSGTSAAADSWEYYMLHQEHDYDDPFWWCDHDDEDAGNYWDAWTDEDWIRHYEAEGWCDACEDDEELEQEKPEKEVEAQEEEGETMEDAKDGPTPVSRRVRGKQSTPEMALPSAAPSSDKKRKAPSQREECSQDRQPDFLTGW